MSHNVELYLKYLLEKSATESPGLSHPLYGHSLYPDDSVYQLIYMFGGRNGLPVFYFYGDFHTGVRGYDHWELLECIPDTPGGLTGFTYQGAFYIFTWEDVMSCGTLFVPETRCYISTDVLPFFNKRGYTHLPVDSNHFVGYKD